MAEFIVLGETGRLKNSSRIINRYKTEEELKDVFKVNRLRKAARKLLVFKVVDEPDDDTWYLITFDIKQVIGKKTGSPRKATKEYSLIKEAMTWSLCGWIDNSTYVCPEDMSDIPETYTKYVQSWPVKPYNEKTLESMRDAVARALAYIRFMLLMQKNRLHGKGIKKAEKMLETLDKLLKMPYMCKVKKLLGIEELKFDEARELRRALEGRKSDGESNGLDLQLPNIPLSMTRTERSHRKYALGHRRRKAGSAAATP